MDAGELMNQAEETEKKGKEYNEKPTLLESYYRIYTDKKKGPKAKDKALKDVHKAKTDAWNSFVEEAGKLHKETVKTAVELSITGLKGAATGKGVKGVVEEVSISVAKDVATSTAKGKLDSKLDSKKSDTMMNRTIVHTRNKCSRSAKKWFINI